MMDITTRNFFRLLRMGAFGEEEKMEPVSAWKWRRLYQLSLMHGISGLMYDGLERCREQFFVQLPDSLRENWSKSTLEMEQRNRELCELTATLTAQFDSLLLRPMLPGFPAFFYDRPEHRSPESIVIFFPFETQGRKADDWAREHGEKVVAKDRHTLCYEWHGASIEHRHRLMSLTNKWHDHSLQNLIEKDIRESQPTYVSIGERRTETTSPTLTLLLVLLGMARGVLNEGVSLKQLADLGIFLRKAGDKVDYVLLQEWTERLRLTRMARLAGGMLTTFLGLTPDEIPFVTGDLPSSLNGIKEELFLLRNPQKESWYFQQGNDIFVHTANTPALLRQMGHSARYFGYYPSESFTNLFAVFAHSLSHIEE